MSMAGMEARAKQVLAGEQRPVEDPRREAPAPSPGHLRSRPAGTRQDWRYRGPMTPHRQADAIVTVVDATGAPIAGEEVVVAQRRHRFLFGATDFDLVDLANGELEGERGTSPNDRPRPSSTCSSSPGACHSTGADSSRSAEGRKHGPDHCRGRGSTIATAAQRSPAVLAHGHRTDWLLDLSDEEIVDAQRGRIRRELPTSPASSIRGT